MYQYRWYIETFKTIVSEMKSDFNWLKILPSVSMKPVDWRTSSKLILPSPSASNKNENIFDSISSVPLFSKKSPIGTDPSVILPSNWNIPFYACFSTFFEKNSCQIIDKKSERDELRDSQCCKISEILYWSTFSWNPFRYISSRALLVPVSPTFWCLYIFLKF